jgi:hypothetical protein
MLFGVPLGLLGILAKSRPVEKMGLNRYNFYHRMSRAVLRGLRSGLVFGLLVGLLIGLSKGFTVGFRAGLGFGLPIALILLLLPVRGQLKSL